jgi:hypothetical protein
MSYPGGKNGSGVYQTLINLMPPHDVYIEPFLGGAAIMRLKRPARLNIGIDLDSAAVETARSDRGTSKSAILPGNSFLNARGFNIVVYFKAGAWHARITHRETGRGFWSRRTYSTPDACKLATFDALVFIEEHESELL